MKLKPEEQGAGPERFMAAPEAAPAGDEDALAFAQAAAEAAAAAALAGEAPTAEEQALAQDAERDARSPDAVDGDPPADIHAVEEEGGLEKLAAKGRRLGPEAVRHLVHALLHVADRPLSIEQLRAATGVEPRKLEKALERLAGELREGVSGVVLSEVGGGYQLRTAPEVGPWVRRFLGVRPRRLTRAALETLAIVAYRQPVTRPEIEDIRGVDCGAVLHALLDAHLVKILGKREEVGRPLLWGTTREFLEFFQLKDLASLPTLREFQELTEESRAIVEEELGPGPAPIEGLLSELAEPRSAEEDARRVAESEAALADLEQAMATAEARAADLADAIRPPEPPREE